MSFAHLRSEERIGLGIALALHVALGVALLVQPDSRRLIPPPETMTVSLSTEVGLEATAPDPVAESAAPTAPVLSPEPALPAKPVPQPAVAQPVARPQPVATTPSRPQPVPRPTAAPQPKPKPAPRATAAPRPKPKPAPASAEPRRRPDAPASQTRATAQPSTRPAGGSRIGADFLPGAGSSTTTRETRVPASQIGASAKASIVQAIARQIKPHWSAPQGADAEQLVTILAFRLNPDGSLAGTPRVVSQSGETDANRPQKKLHAERAIRAVQLAAPFDLPDEYYEAWKSINGARFDRNLSR